MTAPKRWLAHVNFDMTLDDSVRRGMEMRTIPRSIKPSVQRMCVFPAPVCWITARWFGRMGCSRQKTVLSCARNISRIPQTDAEAATMHALRWLLSHPDIGTAVAVSAAVQTPKDKSGRTGERVDVAPVKGRVMGDCVGDEIGRARWGGWIGPGCLCYLFLDVAALFLCQRLSPGRKK